MFTFKRIGSRFARVSEIPFPKPIDNDQFSIAQMRNFRGTNRELFQLLAADKFNTFPNIQGQVHYDASSNVPAQLKPILKQMNMPTFTAEVRIVLRRGEKLEWATCLSRTPNSVGGGGSHKLFSTPVVALLATSPPPRLCVLRQHKGRWMKETYGYNKTTALAA